MIRLLLVAWRNLGRNRLRTVLTVAGAVVALIAFVMLRTVLTSWSVGVDYAAKERLATRHKVTFIMPLPKRYIEDIRAVPGVKAATWANWFGARDPNRPDEFFANMACDAESTLKVFGDLQLAEDQKQAWLTDRQGAIIGDLLAKRMEWKVGQKVVLEGSIYPGTWEFKVSGIYTASSKAIDRSQFFFHWDYMNDKLPPGRKDQIGWVMATIDDASKSAEISRRIDTMFDDRDVQTVTMSEKNMQLSFMAMFSAVLTALEIVSLAILIIMLLILGNTIAMGVRERTREYAVLRAIGFQPGHLAFFVVAESAILGILAGLLGVGIAYPFVNGFVGRGIEENMGAWFPYFRVEPWVAGVAIGIGILLAVVASVIPAWRASSVSVIDALRRVG